MKKLLKTTNPMLTGETRTQIIGAIEIFKSYLNEIKDSNQDVLKLNYDENSTVEKSIDEVIIEKSIDDVIKLCDGIVERIDHIFNNFDMYTRPESGQVAKNAKDGVASMKKLFEILIKKYNSNRRFNPQMIDMLHDHIINIEYKLNKFLTEALLAVNAKETAEEKQRRHH